MEEQSAQLSVGIINQASVPENRQCVWRINEVLMLLRGGKKSLRILRRKNVSAFDYGVNRLCAFVEESYISSIVSRKMMALPGESFV